MEEEMEKIKDELENIKEELRELKGELRIMDRSIDQILEGREEKWATDVWFVNTLTRPQLML